MFWKISSKLTSPAVFLRHRFDVLLVAVISVALCLPLARNLCEAIQGTGFDAQNFYLWEYAASLGAVPYRDIFNIYGYLQYYRTGIPLIFIIYSLIAPVTLIVIYSLFFRRLYSRRLHALFSFICTAVILISALGVHGLSRYGLLIISALTVASAVVFSLKQPRGLVLTGLLHSLVLLASLADGVSAIGLGYLILNLHLLFTHPKNRHLYQSLLTNNLAYTLGLLVGAIPLVSLNTLLDNWAGFFEAFRHLASVPLYAKSDYIPTDRTQAVIFAVIFTVVLVLSLDLVKWRSRIKPQFWLLVSLTMAAIIVQQKNLMRSSTQPALACVSLILYGAMGYTAKSVKSRWLVFTLPLTHLIAAYTLMDLTGTTFPAEAIKDTIITWYQQPPRLHSQLCLIESAQTEKLKGFDRYLPSLSFINQSYSKQALFAFPYAPALYVAQRQIPPPYFNFYDAAPLFAQNRNLAYMATTPVNLVVYDLDALIFDVAPETIRNNLTVKYILRHFEPIFEANNIVVMARVATPSAWLNTGKYPALIERLTKINLGQLPRLEGLKHAAALSTITPATWSAAILVASYPKTLTAPGILLASASGSLITALDFQIQSGGDYLFNLENLPQFQFTPLSLQVKLSPSPSTLKWYPNNSLDLW